MSLDIGRVLREAATRTVRPNGLMLMVVFLVVGLLSTTVQQSALAWYSDFLVPQTARNPGPLLDTLPLALPIPIGPLLGVWLLLVFLGEGVRIVSVRTLVSERTDTIPGEFVSRNIASAILNGFVGGIVVGVLVGLGMVFLVVPGIFLAISFLFVRQEIAVEDVNFVDAMSNSWDLSKGNRVELFVLGGILVAVGIALAIAGAALGFPFDPSSPIPTVFQVVLGAPVAVFGVAIVSRAYVQLKAEDRSEAEAAATDDGDDEWDDPAGVDV